VKSKPIVIKIGGSTFGSGDTTISDLVDLQKQGKDLVVVHGGGALITEWLKRQNITTRFVHGLRVTDEEALKVVVAVLSGLVNKELVASLQKAGAKAVGISGVDGGLVLAERQTTELGYTGEVRSVNCGILESLLEKGFIAVVSPVSYYPEGATGEPMMLNLNGDSVTGEIAAALKADSIIFLTDVQGVKDAKGSYIPELSLQEADELINSGVAAGGMEVKLQACIRVARAGGRARIIDGRNTHALRDELLGRTPGTTIKK
jgi:acetylglutamate kinase